MRPRTSAAPRAAETRAGACEWCELTRDLEIDALGSEDVDARETWRSRGGCGPRGTRDVPTRFASLAA